VEVIEFCIDFIPDLISIGVYIGKEDDYFDKAHYTVLQNSSLVDPYIEVNRTLFDTNSRGRLKLGLCVGTWKLSAVGCKNNVRVTRILMSNCTCCLANHLGIS
jgi:hypothetical protein